MTLKKSKKPSVKPQPWEWSPVDPFAVVTITQDRKIMLGSEQITETELKNLQAEAKVLKNMRIWHVLQETVKQKSIQMGFVEAETWERTMSGKMMLHNLGILKSVVDSLLHMPPQYVATLPPKPHKSGVPIH